MVHEIRHLANWFYAKNIWSLGFGVENNKKAVGTEFLYKKKTTNGSRQLKICFEPEVISLTRRPPFTPQEDSQYSFLLEAESTPVP
jgi:hypothetical protein